MSEITGQKLTKFELAVPVAPPLSLALFCEEEVLTAGLLSLLPAEINVSGRYNDLPALPGGSQGVASGPCFWSNSVLLLL